MSNDLYSTEPADPAAFQAKFDRVYTRIGGLYDLAVKLLPVWRNWIRHALPHITGGRVLEVSFGTGYLLAQYAGRFETHGLELNARMVTIAKRNLQVRHQSAELLRGTVEDLPYRDAFFDTVVSTMAFSGYPDGARAMSELRRVLRPGGRLVLMDVNYPGDRNWLGMRLTRMWQRVGDLIRDMDKLLQVAGFQYSDTEIGGFGSVHLYVCHKR
ncbi:MAG: methyltransferase domain-containing protein [Gemmatimonadales bacterium]|nr:methyltransferase domain-containing protein [Gemmatimonadales bacterium]